MREERGKRVIIFFFSLIVFSQIHGNLTVGIRREKHEKCSTRRGLRVGYQKQGISPRIQVKIQKNPNF